MLEPSPHGFSRSRRRLPYLAFILAALSASAVVPAPAASQERVIVAPAGVVTWDQMLAADATAARAAGSSEPTAQIVPFLRVPSREIGGAGGGGASGTASQPRQTAPVGTDSPAPLGPMASLGFAALGDNNTTIPPDTDGAAGPAHLVTMLNSEVRIQDKVGATVSTVSLSTFWTSGTGLSGSPFDPHIVYDSLSGRWIADCDANGESGTSQVFFAISDNSNPTGAWTFYGFNADPAFPSGTTWADYPPMGVNGTWIAINQNMFTVSGNNFVGAKMWVIDKSTALAGGALTVTIFAPGFDSVTCGGGTPCGGTLVPAVTFDANPTLYLVDSGFFSGGMQEIRLSRITGTGAAPVWSVVPGSSISGSGLFAAPTNFDGNMIDAPQLGSTTGVSTNDPRVINVVLRNGKLWFAHSGGLPVGAVDRTAVFWYQVDPTAMPAPVVQSGVFDGGPGVHHFFASIAANSADDACIGFSRSDATKFIEAVYSSRNGSDSAGAMDPISVLKVGEDTYVKTFGGIENRWGDYSATVIDPADDTTCWTLQEYAETHVGTGTKKARWGTWWGRIDNLPPVPTVTPTPLPTPSCGSAPIAGCRTPFVPTKAQLAYTDNADDTKDKLGWKWTKGSATAKDPDFGDPTYNNDYVLCVYDATPSLITSALMPAGGMCNVASPRPCWTDKSTGFVYKDKDATPDGITGLKLKEGIDGKAKIGLKGKGLNLQMPPLFPLVQPVTVQLLNSIGVCWEATYSAPATKNEAGPPGKFKDKSD